MKKANRIVIKLGGSSLQDPTTLRKVIETIRGYRKYDYSVIIVHGGGPSINEELTKRGITWQFINGQRQTTPEMISIIEEVLVGKINRHLVEDFNAARIPAVGFSGAECETLFCNQASAELGQVGNITKVNTLWIERLLAASGSVVPVVAPIGVGMNGEKYNINADWAASKLASALNAEKLIFLTDQPGIMNPEGQLIASASPQFLHQLVEKKIVTGGMHTKVLTVLEALKSGVPQVRVMSGKEAENALWSDHIGTFACIA
jgi:acetylglutamate kinase